ncbi:DNA polymerase family A [uncultured archaeon]|nr:DNA polymerase family A [uncultured archaeon]
MKNAVNPEQADLFQSSLVSQRLEHAKKTKNVSWLESARLHCVNDEATLRQFVERALASPNPKAADTETTGLRPREDKLVGISVAWVEDDGHPVSFYVPLLSDVDTVKIDPLVTLSILKPLLETKLIWYNFKFDYKFLKAVGIEAGLLADVSLMKLLPKAGLDHGHFEAAGDTSLKELYKKHFGLDMLNLEDALGKGVYNFALASLELGKMYAATDAYATVLLYHKLLDLTDMGFIYSLETQLLPIVANMEYRGIKIDDDSLRKATETFTKENRELAEEIFAMAGRKFNIGSPQQLSELLYGELKLPVSSYTSEDSKTPSTDKAALKKLDHPIVKPILTYKANDKLLTTFLKKLPRALDPEHHLHSNLNSYGAVSGRFTSTSPNIQQIPKAKDDTSNSAVLRKAFVADEGYYLLDVDYGQIEYRIFASLCGDPNLKSAFLNGVDFHLQTASTMFGVPLDKVSDADRQKGKTINFGLLFGMQAYGLSQQLRCSEEEAQKLLDTYFRMMPTVQPWISNEKDRARTCGYAETIYGRKRMLPDALLPYTEDTKSRISKALREAVNHRVQGTAADILKMSMIRLDMAIKKRNWDMHMLMQVHDELVFLVHESIPVSESVALVKKCMELRTPTACVEPRLQDFVPIVADASVGYSWGNSVDYVDGLELEDIPYHNKLIVIGDPKDLVGRGPELKEIFKKYPGKSEVLLNVGGNFVEPSNTDKETGEVTELRILGSKRQIKEIESLGLTVQI